MDRLVQDFQPEISCLFLKNPVKIFLPEKTTDLTFLDLIEGNEFQIITALSDYNVVIKFNEENRERQIALIPTSDSFTCKEPLWFVITSNAKCRLAAPITFLWPTPNRFKVIINNEIVHEENIFDHKKIFRIEKEKKITSSKSILIGDTLVSLEDYNALTKGF